MSSRESSLDEGDTDPQETIESARETRKTVIKFGTTNARSLKNEMNSLEENMNELDLASLG